MQLVGPFSGLESFVRENEPLAPHTWYRIGGPAKWFVQPRSVEELKDAAIRCVENGIQIYVLGLGANLLVGDDGVNGAVFRLDADHWKTAEINGINVEVGAGADMQKLVLKTVRAGLAGVECLAGIPGTIGGGIRMNAGGKFGDLGAVVTRVTVMAADGTIFDRTKDDLVFDYRSTNISAPFILGATLELDEEDPDRIMKRTKEIWMYKRNTQPLNAKNCGCIFKNPRGLSAGALIDQAGLKGMVIGGAEVSTKHANFIIAHPGCKADDVMRLVKIIREKVWEKNQIHLESEVKVWA
ncbi:UDP-N-acetylmuramate dehydrogenase [Humisphaera borealis]|uniref:UDP-N-acetylenolpyruvoylglucosamine reductase n=2 Tax=Humisphaera borealis TaxID=2807512 RepID=A0A7M2X519_9BACT|nr:UDP-N-acetylmuramate dehydrogenase [Humisphaera borealis]